MVDLPSATLCYICGARLTKTSGTRDHIFPKCLFPRPLPDNLPTIHACRQCNEGLSKDEELFRVFVASGMAYESKAGFSIWTQRIRSALQGGRPGLKPFLQSLARVARVVSESGGFFGHTLILETDPEPINRVLRKIVRGLYFLDTKQVLPNDVEILVDYDAGQPERFISPPLDEAIRGAKRVEIGNGVVTYWRNTIKDDLALSLTWLEFYKDKVFLVCTTR